ncbi:MAG: MBL fold metallo-hydrolase [Woeseiaceae bacterium]|nr:MBL fold metallo-hydrolase [Woeseiaceae bacterium]
MNKLHKLLFFIIFPMLHASSTALAQDFDEVQINVHPVAGQVYYIEGRGGNIGLFVGDDGVFLIDDQFAPLTDKIVAAIRPLSDKPIRFLVNTHLHPDHTGGNENFGKMGALVFGHDNVRRQMQISAYTQEPPLVTYSQDVSFHINGETVHVFKTPDAHTNGDSYIFFKGSNVIHAGDVYRTTSYPYIDTNNGGSFLGTIKALELLADVADGDTKIIPGHGVISNAEEAQAFLDMLLVIRDRVKGSIDDGLSLEEAQAAGLTKEYDERWESGRRIGSSAALLGAAYADMAQR